MSQAEVGALRVVLGMDVAQFSEGAKKAGDALDGLASKFGLTQKNLERAGIAITAAFTAAAVGIAVGIKSALDRADELSKLSQKIGLPIEQLSSLAYAADLAGVPLEGLANGVKKLSVNLQMAASGEITPAASRALAALGVSATGANGALRPTNEVLLQLADKFAGLRDGAGKTALAVEIFGKQGSELIPLLNQGAAGLKEMTDRAESMGLILDSKTGRAAEEFNDRLTDIGFATKGLFTQISAKLLPVINDLTQAFADWVRGSGDAEPAAQRIANAITSIYIAALETAAGVERLGIRLKAFWSSTVALFTSDEVAKIQQGAQDAIKKIDDELKARETKINELATKGADDEKKPGGPQQLKDAPLIQSTKALSDAQRELNKLIQEGVNLVKQTRNPYEVMTDQIKSLDAAMKAGKITAEQHGVAMQKAALVSLNAYAGMASGIANNLATAFGHSKAFAIAAALINTFESVTKTLATYGYTPWGIAAAAAAAAAGLAQVAQIRSTNKGSSSGSASAGSSGGASTGSSSAGPPVAPAQAAAQQSFTISLQGDRFGREQVRGLIESINDAISDGAVLRVAA